MNEQYTSSIRSAAHVLKEGELDSMPNSSARSIRGERQLHCSKRKGPIRRRPKLRGRHGP
jgi:hypothetical protein